MFGDDVEQDADVFTLFARVVSGFRGAALESWLKKSKVSKKDIDNALNNLSNETIYWTFNENIIEAAEDADAVVLLTQWEDYLSINWREIFSKMRKPAWIFDTRSILKKELLQKIGFNFWGLGDGRKI